MARMMPPMLQVMKDVGGVEVPEFVAKLTGDAPPSTNGAHTSPATTAGESDRPV
jgi:flotillin